MVCFTAASEKWHGRYNYYFTILQKSKDLSGLNVQRVVAPEQDIENVVKMIQEDAKEDTKTVPWKPVPTVILSVFSKAIQ